MNKPYLYTHFECEHILRRGDEKWAIHDQLMKAMINHVRTVAKYKLVKATLKSQSWLTEICRKELQRRKK